MDAIYYIIVCFKFNNEPKTLEEVSNLFNDPLVDVHQKSISEYVVKERISSPGDEGLIVQIHNNFCKKIKEIFDVTICEKDILPARDSIPEKLYLYRGWSNCPSKNMEIIKNHKFYLSDPKNFNDPFDCQMQIYFLDSDIACMAKYVGIRCFSAAWNNILMWSHYANKHKGFCIEFDTSLLTARSFGEIIKVRYVNKMPTYLGIDNIDIKRFLCYKYKDWEYEKEYRLICLKNENPEFEFPMNAITKVYLGCRMDENAKKTVKSFTRESDKMHDTHIQIMELRADEDDFALKEYPYD